MDTVIRAAVLFVILMVLLRLIGRRELGEMEPADLVLLIVMGDLVQQAITRDDSSMTGAVLAVGTISLLTVAVSYTSFRFRRARPLLEGSPVVLISDGRLLERNMRRQRISHAELASQARMQQIAHLRDVRWAVLETSGQISFIPR